MDFVESTQYLFSLGNEVSAMKLGLKNIRKLLDELENPQNNFLKIQVAGTNGKGSVCAFLDSICNTAGIKTGTFTSPHLISITERIRINGRDLSESDFARHANRVRVTAEKMLASGELEYRPTFFEQITAIALIAFADADVDLAILETGLGGRLDATTAANAEIAAITRIDLDHQQYLGVSIEQIAAEKAAIIQAKTQTVIVGDQVSEALTVIENEFRKNRIEPRSANALIRAFPPLGLAGKHQIENAKIAISIAEELKKTFPVADEDIALGLANARHPGRLEYQGRYLFDGAHNAGGAVALAEYLGEFEPRPITMIFGVMREKNVTEILSILASHTEKIILTVPANERSLSYDELLVYLPSEITRAQTFVSDNVACAINIAEVITQENEIILVTGSLYLVGEVKKILNNKEDRQAVGFP